jgi:uncharacterized protein with von Willebrand factor type A (vWA) domain
MKKPNRHNALLNSLHPTVYSVINNLFDIDNFQDLVDKNTKLFKIYREGQKTYPQFKELHQDVYSSLYKYRPEIEKFENMAYRHMLNHRIMTHIVASPKYKELRNITRLDKIQTALGCEIIGDEVKKLVDELRDEVEQAVKAAEEAAAQLAAAQEGKEGEEEGVQAHGVSNDDKKITLEEAKKALAEAEKKIREVIEKTDQRQINRMVESAVNATTETSNLISNWGLEKDPSYAKGGYQEKIELLNRLRESEKLRKIAEWAGRYRRMALDTLREKIRRGSEAVYDIITGKDIGRLIPSEAAMLTKETTRNLFYKKFSEGNLLIYEYSGTNKKNKGPIVCCIDSSGSMSGIPELWSKAVALGLLEIAKVQKRDMYVIHFSSSWYGKDSGRLHTNNFPKEVINDLSEVIDMCEYFEGGGTLFEPPLNLAREKINESENFSKADIIFITDGNSAVSDEWLKSFQEWKKQKNVKIYSILIDVTANTDVVLREFSERVDKLSSINTSQDQLATVLFKVV